VNDDDVESAGHGITSSVYDRVNLVYDSWGECQVCRAACAAAAAQFQGLTRAGNGVQ
jgi:hypothetical protein